LGHRIVPLHEGKDASVGNQPDNWQDLYPRVYGAIAPGYRALPQADVEAILKGVFGESAAIEDVEGFFDDIGNALNGVGSTIGRVAEQAAPVS
jgi:hypothetical protein